MAKQAYIPTDPTLKLDVGRLQSATPPGALSPEQEAAILEEEQRRQRLRSAQREVRGEGVETPKRLAPPSATEAAVSTRGRVFREALGPPPEGGAGAQPGQSPRGSGAGVGPGGGGGISGLMGQRMPPELEQEYLSDPDAFRSEVEQRRLRGDISGEEAASFEQRLERPSTVTDLQGALYRHQIEGERIASEYAARDAQIEAERQRRAADQARQDIEFERSDRAAAEARTEALSRGERVYQERSLEADRRVEDYRIKDRRTGGQIVLEMFSRALSQYASVLARDPSIAQNVANTFEANMQRSFAAQEAELGKRKGAAQQVRSDLSAYREAFLDKESAQAALRARYYQEGAAKARETAALMTNQRAAAAVSATADEFENRAEQMATQAKLGLATGELQQMAASQVAPAEPQGPPGFISVVDDKLGENYIESHGVFIPNQTRYTQISQGLEQSRMAVATIDEIIALAGQPGSKLSPAVRAQIQSAEARGIQQMSTALGSGAVNGEDGVRSKQMLGAGVGEFFNTDTVTGAGVEALKQSRAALIQGEKTAIQTAGAIRGHRRPSRDKKGNFQWELTLEDPAQQQQVQHQQGIEEMRRLAGEGQ